MLVVPDELELLELLELDELEDELDDELDPLVELESLIEIFFGTLIRPDSALNEYAFGVTVSPDVYTCRIPF